jgi:membrane protein
MEKKVKKSGAALNSMLLTLVQIITIVLGIIVTKLLSVYFSLEDYGTYSQALLITTTATSISILGLTNATNYFYNRTENTESKKEYLATIFTIQYVVGISIALFLIVFRSSIANYFDNERLNNIMLIVAFTPLLTNLIAMYQNLFVSIGEAKKIAARNFVVSIIKLIAVIIACFVTKNIVTVLIILLTSDILQVIYFSLLFTRYQWPIQFSATRRDLINEILKFSIPMAVYVMTNSLSRDIDKYVISAFSDTATLAIYSNAAKILPFDLLTTSLITVLVPIITRQINHGQKHEAHKLFKLYLQIGYILTCTFVGGAVAVSKYLMLFLYDVKYLAGYSVFVIYLFVDMVRFANVTTILSGSGKTKTLMAISIVILILNACFNVIAFLLFGMIGPAVTTLVLTILMNGALLHFGAKEIESSIIQLFDIKEFLIVGTEILVFASCTHYLSNILFDRGTNLFFNLVISFGSYSAIMLFLNYKRIYGCLKMINQYK